MKRTLLTLIAAAALTLTTGRSDDLGYFEKKKLLEEMHEIAREEIEQARQWREHLEAREVLREYQEERAATQRAAENE